MSSRSSGTRPIDGLPSAPAPGGAGASLCVERREGCRLEMCAWTSWHLIRASWKENSTRMGRPGQGRQPPKAGAFRPALTRPRGVLDSGEDGQGESDRPMRLRSAKRFEMIVQKASDGCNPGSQATNGSTATRWWCARPFGDFDSSAPPRLGPAWLAHDHFAAIRSEPMENPGDEGLERTFLDTKEAAIHLGLKANTLEKMRV